MIVTLLVLVTTCVVSYIAFQRPATGHQLVLWPPAVTRQKQYYRLLTYGFVHADVPHLLFNMVTLFFFGRIAESYLFVPRVGPVGFLLVYLGALLVSILPSYLRHRNDSNYMSLGASGAVSAMLFASILLSPWTRIIVFVLPVPAILYAVFYVGYSLYMDHRGGDNVNHSAHLWGAAYGVVVALLLNPGLGTRFLTLLLHPGYGG